jgi:L-arabinokinase
VSAILPRSAKGNPLTIAFYISGHGFGHASRVIEVINAIAAIEPATTVLVRTAAARWLFDVTLRTPADIHHVIADVGMLQTDSLHLDVPATFHAARDFYAGLETLAAHEGAMLAARGVDLVVADLPPLGLAAASFAGIPAIAMGNFTWDWIYAGYPEHQTVAPDVVPIIRRAHRVAALVLRLPMWGGFEGFDCPIIDVPFVARHSTRDPRDVRAKLGVPDEHRMVLASFGGLGIAGLNLEALARAEGYTIVTTGHALGLTGAVPNRVVLLDDAKVYESGLRYEDLVRAADAVVTKPGYGILAECIANDTAVLYTSRGHFVEYDVMVAAMPDVLKCRFIGHDDLYAGRWQPHLDQLLAQPAPPTRPATNGAEIAARYILGQ